MAKRIYRYILFIFITAVGMDFAVAASAQENIQKNINEGIKEDTKGKAKESAGDGAISRPVVEYKSGNLRDPFRPLTVAREMKTEQEKKVDLIQAGSDLGNFKVQGIIWGGRFPQAIVNNRVVIVGDTIDGAEILSIDKNGITLSSGGGANKLTVSMETPALKKGE